MMTIHGRGNETVWDFEKNQPLMKFQDGIFQTGDPAIARKLQGIGYRVEGLEAPKSTPKKPS